jgi:hypothetical protein
VTEDLECVAEVEFLVDDGGAVALEAEVCELFFLGGEEGCVCGGAREVP